MTNILITGGAGVVGQQLTKTLINKGYSVAVLSRTKQQDSSIKTYTWDIEKGEIEQEAIDTADFIIHLAGANIGEKRWTAKRKQLILDSRVKSTQLIYSKISTSNTKLKAFISASATGYYGAITTAKIFSETDPPATDFLGDTCMQWEASADAIQHIGIRTVKIRTGIVLSKKGGALEKLAMTVNTGFGSPIGSGKQYMPWIHIDDLCNIYLRAIEDQLMQGAYNAVSPEHTTNKEFIKTLATVLNKPCWFPNVPGILLKLLLGNMSDIVLKGSRVSSAKIIKAGYQFQYTNLTAALKDVLKNK